MKILKITDFNMDQNSYLIYKDKDAILIDPGANYEKIIRELEENDLNLNYILLTHCHYDHIKDCEKIKKSTSAIVLASEECKNNIKDKKLNVSYLFNDEISYDLVDKAVEDEEIIINDIKIKVIKTPGHTNCSVCFLIEDNLFSGDTLFLRTVGRWDLPTGDFNTLKNSIVNKIYTLDDNIKVYAGHGNDTTVGYEKNFNMCVFLG